MTLEINGVHVNGAESQNATKAPATVTGTVFDAEGQEAAYEGTEGRIEYTGGVNWDKPVVDIGAYLQDGTNTIRIVYNSSITNAALAAEIITARGQEGRAWYGSPAIWWGTSIDYRANGPAQAKLIPYRDILITE